VSIITRYGYDNVIVLLAIGAALGVAAYLLRTHTALSIILGAVGILIIVFTMWFFRDPERVLPPEALDGRHVVAPADGRVVQITRCIESEYLRDSAIQISIFLSPLDVHVNRYPVSGVVEYVRYHPGKYLVAWHPKSSELNERSTIGVRTPHGNVVFRQITGILARRIVFETNVGDTITAGTRFGMMKFGSRMDVLLPTNAQIAVQEGDRVRAAETIIAVLP
jgi:phosphatidylserine decarboxylase